MPNLTQHPKFSCTILGSGSLGDATVIHGPEGLAISCQKALQANDKKTDITGSVLEMPQSQHQKTAPGPPGMTKSASTIQLNSLDSLSMVTGFRRIPVKPWASNFFCSSMSAVTA